jgi:hypothetical protein
MDAQFAIHRGYFGDFLEPGRFGVCFALIRQSNTAPMALAEEAPAEDWRAR